MYLNLPHSHAREAKPKIQTNLHRKNNKKVSMLKIKHVGLGYVKKYLMRYNKFLELYT